MRGLEVVISKKPDIILLDIIMPRMDGLTMLKKMREKAEVKDIPVILLTNLSEYESMAEAIKSGAFGYLVKTDWTLSKVVEKVRDRLENARKQ